MASKLSAFYTTDSGVLKRENDPIARPDLAAALDLIAQDGASALYTGTLGDDIVEEVHNYSHIYYHYTVEPR